MKHLCDKNIITIRIKLTGFCYTIANFLYRDSKENISHDGCQTSSFSVVYNNSTEKISLQQKKQLNNDTIPLSLKSETIDYHHHHLTFMLSDCQNGMSSL